MGKPISSGKKQRSAVVLNKKAGGLREAGEREPAERAGQTAGCSWSQKTQQELRE